MDQNMEVKSRAVFAVPLSAACIWMAIALVEGKYGPDPAALGATLVTLSLVLGGLIIVCFRYSCSVARFAAVAVLTAIGVFSFAFVIAAWVIALWRFNSFGRPFRGLVIEDVPASLYLQAEQELERGSADRGLLAKAMALSDGDGSKADAYYVKERALALAAEASGDAQGAEASKFSAFNQKRFEKAGAGIVVCVWLPIAANWLPATSVWLDAYKASAFTVLTDATGIHSGAWHFVLGFLAKFSPTILLSIPLLVVIGLSANLLIKGTPPNPPAGGGAADKNVAEQSVPPTG